ncbi:hypothetical protein R9C00_16730 [Flammeovirgaceae bacterium SG7u.111]|nr:hypothetical protein [Flammeovirgaceae bacterium SG7u.132]WPO33349.1 hypothetical protein R9C00_16730 [Flammeovirgaceae bacterium SG7u.111]
MKILLTILTILLSLPCWANMASPIQEGTWAATPFISKYVDILREKIHITPDRDFRTAKFTIEYHINAGRSGEQIPLLFYASEFKESFKVWVDGVEINLSTVPEAYTELEGTPFSDFGYFFETKGWSDTKQVHIENFPSGGFYVSIDDLKFFETDLAEGNHLIKVEYVAEQWVDRSWWVKEYSFRYALSPAKYWKSFGELEITLDASGTNRNFVANIGQPTKGDLASTAVWTFSALPTEVLIISHIPEMNAKASMLLAISPTGLAAIFAVILMLFHFLAMWLFRKTNSEKRFSWVMIIGCLAIPFAALVAYIFSFGIIDDAIGPDAGNYHGYTFMVIVYYPILLAVYWLFMWLVDRQMAKRFR